ncbi:hypothetical protein NX059_005615 [Plenodomus lindquistii]|nr:hypothetical protein NX059_005615 [Plenodomus lindquistii]
MSSTPAPTTAETTERVPQFVLDHAPLLHLFTTDPYRPSSLSTHLSHTHPCIVLEPLNLSSSFNLSNLDDLNKQGGEKGKDVYLTSNDDVSTNPAWLNGIDVDATEQNKEDKTSVIVIVDKGKGQEGSVIDVFYFYFFSFNWGGVVLERQLGDHVGDWEHNMIRFQDGVPKAVWFSQHANGEAYTFSCLEKDGSGRRPVVYCANGSHALYPTPGTHDHTIPNLNLPTPLLLVDETDAGPLYDPVPASYIYSYSEDIFTSFTPDAPTSYLFFNGRWGDAEYPESDPRQAGKGLFGFKKYVGGPTGPADKQLERKEVWPENQWSQGQRVRSKLPGTGWWEKTVGKVRGRCFGVKIGKGQGVKSVKVSGEVVG